MPHFSIITAFRNRDANRVKNSLNSLAAQQYTDFELIFIDYGSSPEITAQVKPLVDSYSFAQYILTDTFGMYWSRAHSLNIGIKMAQGDICILWDIDLMVEPLFLNQLNQFDFGSIFTTHKCYYLPTDADGGNFRSPHILNKSEQAYVGLCAVKADVLHQICGFDEFYQVWGAEDDDLYTRLQACGLQRLLIDTTQIHVYHQWHATQAPALPDPWYLTMISMLYSAEKHKMIDYGKLISAELRLAKLAFESGSYKNGQKEELIMWNKTFMYNNFMYYFYSSSPGTLLYIEHAFPQMDLNKGMQKLMHWFNSYFTKSKKNIRLINSAQTERTALRDNIYSFIKYFVGTNRHLIVDYYLDWRPDGFVLVVVKN